MLCFECKRGTFVSAEEQVFGNDGDSCIWRVSALSVLGTIDKDTDFLCAENSDGLGVSGS